MGQELNLKISGLNTNPSPLGAREGSLGVASNINIDQPNTATSRRGKEVYGTEFSSANPIDFQDFFTFENTVVSLEKGKLFQDTDDAGTWGEIGTILLLCSIATGNAVVTTTSTSQLFVGMALSGYGIAIGATIISITNDTTFEMSLNATETTSTSNVTFRSNPSYLSPINTRIGVRTVENNGSMFFTSDSGLYKLDTLDSYLMYAGVPRAINGEAILNVNTGWFDFDNQVAYRIIWGIKDNNNVLNYGAPSERIEITNPTSTAATRTTDLTIYIPDNITESHFYQVYRSGLSGGEEIVANDEMQLVYESNPTLAEINNSLLTFTDDTPDVLKGETIYTAPTQQGILQANNQPPLANDITMFRNFCFYANTETKHSQILTYLGSISATDTITIAGNVYTAVDDAPSTADEFQIGTGTVSEEIAETSKNLVKAVNTYTANTTVSAYYVSGYEDLPGQIQIENNLLADVSFDIQSTSAGSNFNPNITVAVSSDNEEKPARIYISKQNQVDSVPQLQYIDAGGQDSAILRIIAIRESIFVFKDNGQVYRIYGDDIQSFNANLFDSTVNLLAPRSAYVFNNQIFALTDQGVVSISNGGVIIRSYDIEQQIKAISADDRPDFEAYAFSYESERKYILATTNGCYVFNSLTNSWTTWDIVAPCGFVNLVDDKIYWGDNTDGFVHRERKNNDIYDYADEDISVNIASVTDNTIELISGLGVNVGDTIKQGALYATIISQDGDDTFTVEEGYVFSTGLADVYTPIECMMEWLPSYGDNPGYMKKFRQLMIFFRDINRKYNLRFYTNFSKIDSEPNYISVNFEDSSFGDGYFGEGAFGQLSSGNQETRTFFPLDTQRCLSVGINIRTDTAFTKFSLNAISMMYEPQSDIFL